MLKTYTKHLFGIAIFGLIAAGNLHAQNAEAKFMQADEYFSSKQFVKAIEVYEDALKKNPSNNTAWFRLATSYYSTQNYEGAIKAYKHLAPNGNPTVLYNLACSLSLNGNKDEAFKYLEEAVQKGFKQIATLKNDTDLKNLRDDERFEKIVNIIKTCENTPEFHQFDFWVGEWNVFNPQNQIAGESRIEKILKGCIILENWTGRTGFEGKSFNHYDAKKNKWYQYWINENSEVINFEGEYSDKDKAIIFYSSDHAKDENPFIRRLTFFNIDENTVRQFSQQSKDNGKTWTVEYDFKYVRKNKK